MAALAASNRRHTALMVMATSGMGGASGEPEQKRISLRTSSRGGSSLTSHSSFEHHDREDNWVRGASLKMHRVLLHFDDPAVEVRYLTQHLIATSRASIVTVGRSFLFVVLACAWLAVNAPDAAYAAVQMEGRDARAVLSPGLIVFICLASFFFAMMLMAKLLVYLKPRGRYPLVALKAAEAAMLLWPLALGMLFSHWMRLIGTLRYTSCYATLFIICYEAYLLLPGSAFFTFVSVCLIWTHHFVLMGSFTLTTAELPGGRSFGSWVIDYTTLIADILCPSTVLLFMVARHLEMHRREDFALERKLKQRRNVSGSLVANMLPAPVILKISQNLGAAPGARPLLVAWRFPCMCILQSDIVSFTSLGSRITAEQLCTMLHDLFSRFDDITVSEPGVYKIETIGDAFIAATSCVATDKEDPLEVSAAKLCRTAIRMQQACASFKAPDGSAIRMRIGLHTTSCVAGVVGTAALRYHIFGHGPTDVTTLEQSCDIGRVRLSQAFADSLGPAATATEFPLEVAGPLALQAGGTQQTYHLTNVVPPPEPAPPAA